MYFVNTKFMWKIAIVGFVLMIVGLCSIKDNAWISHGNFTATKVVEIEGHKYVIMIGHYSGGIIHAESCGCKK